jgi:hypothetical protein
MITGHAARTSTLIATNAAGAELAAWGGGPPPDPARGARAGALAEGVQGDRLAERHGAPKAAENQLDPHRARQEVGGHEREADEIRLEERHRAREW